MHDICEEVAVPSRSAAVCMVDLEGRLVVTAVSIR